MVTRSEVDTIEGKIVAIENMMPGIQLQSQQQDQATTAVEGRMTAIEGRIQTIGEASAASINAMEAIIDAKIRTAIQMSDVK